MDAVTRHVLRMLEDDTIGAGDAKKVIPLGMTEALLTDNKEHPIGDVSGKVAGPGLTGGGIEKDSQGDAQQPKDATKKLPHGMTDDLLRSLPNAFGRMARMGDKP